MQKIAGGKRKVNKSLKAWVAFVKKVQREEKLSYKEAIHRAKQRKDKGEKWMKGGDGEDSPTSSEPEDDMTETIDIEDGPAGEEIMMDEDEEMAGGRRRRRTMRRSRSARRSRRRSHGRGRSRASRRY